MLLDMYNELKERESVTDREFIGELYLDNPEELIAILMSIRLTKSQFDICQLIFNRGFHTDKIAEHLHIPEECVEIQLRRVCDYVGATIERYTTTDFLSAMKLHVTKGTWELFTNVCEGKPSISKLVYLFRGWLTHADCDTMCKVKMQNVFSAFGIRPLNPAWLWQFEVDYCAMYKSLDFVILREWLRFHYKPEIHPAYETLYSVLEVFTVEAAQHLGTFCRLPERDKKLLVSIAEDTDLCVLAEQFDMSHKDLKQYLGVVLCRVLGDPAYKYVMTDVSKSFAKHLTELRPYFKFGCDLYHLVYVVNGWLETDNIDTAAIAEALKERGIDLYAKEFKDFYSVTYK